MNCKPISIIIPAKNASETIEFCLRAVLSQDGYVCGQDYEVIVVDDGSSDDTADIAERLGIRVVRQTNAGPASARNHGARIAGGELLLFTDADCQPQNDWIYQITLPFHDSLVVGVKGAYSCSEKNPIARFVQLEFAYKYQAMAHLARIDFIDTYSAAYRREVFLEHGGFDERFPVPSVEDQEFSFRLARLGYQLIFAPNARVQHRHDLSLAEYGRRKWGIGYWKAFMLKWLPEKGFGDTYTPLSQRVQIVLLALMLMILVPVIFELFTGWVILAFAAFFYMSSFKFILFTLANDPKIFLTAMILLPVRSAALGFGLLAGILFAPRIAVAQRPVMNFWEHLLKRVVDIFGSLLGLIVFSPVLAICGLAVIVDSPGSPFFSQYRAGRNGVPFRLYKLRTMFVGSETKDVVIAKQHYDIMPPLKLQNDPRVTKVGRFLRRWSLDELPQFWNILRGDMSLVGPRPEAVWIVSGYTTNERERLVVKPGLTGPMQISGRADLDFDQRLACELEYVQHFSIWKDVVILVKSIGIVISGKGAY